MKLCEKIRIVIIDIGHQDSDIGACANGIREVDLNVQIAKTVKAELERHGVTVIITTGTLLSRVQTEHIKEPEYFISIHCNAGGGDGAEVWVYGNVFPQRGLAQNIIDAIKADGCNNIRGIKDCKGTSKELYVLKNTYCPAVLVECAFIDSKDVECVDELHEQQAFGKAIAKGILQTLKIDYIEESTSNTLYRVCVGAYRDKNNATKVQAEAKTKGFKDTYIVEVKDNG